MIDGNLPRPATLGVLICDDSKAIREVLREVIELRGRVCVLGEASDGNEAILETTRLQPDVILLDLAMPLRTGVEVIGEIRQIVPEARIIVLSSLPALVMSEAAISLGASVYIEKGASPHTINDAIEAVTSPSPASVQQSPSGTVPATGTSS